MNIKRCKCGVILDTDKVKKCVICEQKASEMAIVPSTSKNIEEAEFFDLLDEVINETLEHPEKHLL